MAHLISKCIDGTRLAVLHFSLFLHLFSAFCSFFFFFFCSRRPCFKVASMLERCSIFYRQLVGRTVQQKVPLVQTHLLKYSYPICLLRVFFFFLSKLNYILHNCLWQAEVQPTDFIHASNSDCITHIQWLLCLRFGGVCIWGGGGVVLISLEKFFSLLLRYVGFLLFWSFHRLVYLGLFTIEK